MSKDFDLWNAQKKSINQKGTNKFYHPREVWWCYLGVNVGFEQDGTGRLYQRPVAVLRAFNKHVCLVVPLTTSTKENKYHLPVGTIDTKTAFAITSQIRLVDTKRFINRIHVLDAETFTTIKKAVKELL